MLSVWYGAPLREVGALGQLWGHKLLPDLGHGAVDAQTNFWALTAAQTPGNYSSEEREGSSRGRRGSAPGVRGTGTFPEEGTAAAVC